MGAPGIGLGAGSQVALGAAPCLQEFPRLKQFPACVEPLMGTTCEEKQTFLQLPETLEELRTRLMDLGLSFINQLLLKGQYRAARATGHSPAFWGRTAPLGSVWGSRHSQRALPAPVCLPPGDAACWKPTSLSGRTLGCKSVLSKAPPSPPRH